jgi:LDH2 family malate/lactate/ureidoglycolate dehydrogenase
MSTTVVARGKLRLAAQRNERIPEGIGLDKHGKPTTDGMEAFHGVTLPFGGYKGAALSVMMDVFAGVLTGAAFGGNVASLYNDFTNKQNVGHFVVAIKPDLFMPMSEFKGRMDDLVRRIKQQPLAEGFDEILMVGEPESRSAQERIKHGIPIQNDVIGLLKAEADKLGISFPHPIDNT